MSERPPSVSTRRPSMRTAQLLLAFFVALATGRSPLNQKLPQRSAGAVRKATAQAMAGYQGPSVTKDAEPKPPKLPIAAQKKPQRSAAAVRTATRLGMNGYQGASMTKDAKPKPQRSSSAEQKKPQRSAAAVRKATRQAVTGYQGRSTTRS